MDEDGEDFVLLVLDEGEALLLQDILMGVRGHLELRMHTADLMLDRYAARRLNSDIDPIISQLETELENLGV